MGGVEQRADLGQLVTGQRLAVAEQSDQVLGSLDLRDYVTGALDQLRAVLAAGLQALKRLGKGLG